jgi:hypothetical protein
MKTAVEWFIINLIQVCGAPPEGTWKEAENLLQQAKEMEKEQIGKAFLNGRIKEIGQGVLFDLQPLTETFNDYYNETFKSE